MIVLERDKMNDYNLSEFDPDNAKSSIVGVDYNGALLKPRDRVRSIYPCELNNIGTITENGCIVYDDEPETEYQILDSRYLVKIESAKHL